jgi:ABC-2 type transport system permease protein
LTSRARTGPVLDAFLRRDFSVATSYRWPFVFDFAAGLLTIVTFSFVGELVNEGDVPGGYFAFAMVGLTLAVFLQAGLGMTAGGVRQEQVQGTLEAVMAAGVRPSAIAAGYAAYPMAWAVALACVYVAGAGVLGADAPSANWSLAAATTVLGAVSFAGLGFIGAALVLVVRRGQAIVAWVVALMSFAAGEVFPPELLPGWIQALGVISPYTRSLSLLRDALFEGASWSSSAGAIVALLLSAVVWTAMGVWAFRVGLAMARRSGSLSGY